jgi:uncharacterized protein YbjT (DUF2867 family)
MRSSSPVLVTGATGYVGGRLIPALLQGGYRVRAMGRPLQKLACRPWARHPALELVQGDVLDLSSLEAAAAGCALTAGPEPFAPEEKEVCFLPRDERNAVRERRNI